MVLSAFPARWVTAGLVVLGLVPLAVAGFEVIASDSNSVTFLGAWGPGLTWLVITYYLLLVGLGIAWFLRQLMAITRLRNEKAVAELMLLKSQVNPHFFFNVLNNLYGWVGKDPIKAQGLILRLSDLMRYTIYQGSEATVTVQAEVDHLHNFIELQRMRYQKEIAIDFNCVVDEDHPVIPLLFIILLENAFKHGVDSLRENAFIRMALTSRDGAVIFSIENNFTSPESLHSKGIGLQNLQRRLALTYPGKHRLSFGAEENVFKATLMMEVI